MCIDMFYHTRNVSNTFVYLQHFIIQLVCGFRYLRNLLIFFFNMLGLMFCCDSLLARRTIIIVIIKLDFTLQLLDRIFKLRFDL